ncbi:putative arginine--tRNA ligase [Helianthus anomalus]
MEDSLLKEVTECHILPRLHVKDLLRFKTVCKAWNSLISSPTFIERHLWYSFEIDKASSRFVDRRICLGPKPDASLDSRSPHKITGSCNGLLCIRSYCLGTQLSVVNPLTREKGVVHPPPRASLRCWGFGYDAPNNDFKVVVGVRENFFQTRFYVLSLSSNTWKEIGTLDLKVDREFAQACDGALHWLAHLDVKKKPPKIYILSLDVSTEKFSQLLLPDDPSYRDIWRNHLGIVNGCICLFRPSSDNSFVEMLWMLRNSELRLLPPHDHERKYDIQQRFFYVDASFNIEETLELSRVCLGMPTFVRSLVSPHPYPYSRIQDMLTDGIDTWAPKLSVKRATVDFSSPNIAKDMHVGHLRSTIIGDTIARMLEYSKVDVSRRNDVGNWGTKFGMLIEFLFEKFPDGEVTDHDVGKLEERFDDDDEFKERARKAVVALQSGKEEKYQKAWAQICETSQGGFKEVYQRLGVHLEDTGESFYNTYIPLALKELIGKGLIKDDEGAKVIKIVEGKKLLPLVATEKDGGYNYASTDLATLWYWLNVEKAEWIIYVTDVGQREHFKKIFAAAKSAEWLPADESKYPKTSHVGFGLVLGDDGKRSRTRGTEVVKLVDLLDEAKTRCKAVLVERGMAAKELEQTAEAVGYGAVKYAALKYNILTNCTFNIDQMLNDKACLMIFSHFFNVQGNTAVYLLSAHARICSIIRGSGKDIEQLKREGQMLLQTDDERKLGLHLLQFGEVVKEACTNLSPHVLCEYLYVLSGKFTSFYSECKVVGSAEETRRLLLCEATAVVMRKCFHLLGITPVYKI